MIKSIEGNFENPEVNELLIKHFIELRGASPEGSAHVLDIPGLKDPTIKFWSLWENDNLMGCGALKFLDKEHGITMNLHFAFSNFLQPSIKLFKTFSYFFFDERFSNLLESAPVVLPIDSGLPGILDLLYKKKSCLLYTSPSPRDRTRSRMPSSA